MDTYQPRGLFSPHRHMKVKMRQRGLIQGLLALVVAAACGGDNSVGSTNATPSLAVQASVTPSSPAPSPQASVSPTPRMTGTPYVSPTPAPVPSPTPSAVFNGRFGFLYYQSALNTPSYGPVGWKVWNEPDVSVLTLHTGAASDGINVSPNGRRIAYMSRQELRVLDLSYAARPRTLLTLPTGESSGHIVWSSDGTGLVLGVTGGGGGVADAFPGYSAIRVIDVAGGPPREIVRVPSSNIVPLSWDRQAKLIAAHEPFCCGSLKYDTLTEDGTLQRTSVADGVYVSQASADAKHVFSRNLAPTSLIRIWPVDSYAGGIDIRAAAGKTILDAAWRPGTSELGVLFDDHLEFWNPSGARRTMALPVMPPLPAANPNAVLLFRTDGSAAFINRRVDASVDKAYIVAVNLGTGQTEVPNWPAWAPGKAVNLAQAQ